jgi:hypothetical protein
MLWVTIEFYLKVHIHVYSASVYLIFLSYGSVGFSDLFFGSVLGCWMNVFVSAEICLAVVSVSVTSVLIRRAQETAPPNNKVPP